MGLRFRICFQVLFVTYLVQIVLSIATYLSTVPKLRSQCLRAISFGNIIASASWIYAFYCRITHAGRVCSGDFLQGANDDKYLVLQGLFLKWAIIVMTTLAVTWIMLSVVFISLRGLRMSQESVSLV